MPITVTESEPGCVRMFARPEHTSIQTMGASAWLHPVCYCYELHEQLSELSGSSLLDPGSIRARNGRFRPMGKLDSARCRGFKALPAFPQCTHMLPAPNQPRPQGQGYWQSQTSYCVLCTNAKPCPLVCRPDCNLGLLQRLSQGKPCPQLLACEMQADPATHHMWERLKVPGYKLSCSGAMNAGSQ